MKLRGNYCTAFTTALYNWSWLVLNQALDKNIIVSNRTEWSKNAPTSKKNKKTLVYPHWDIRCCCHVGSFVDSLEYFCL